ncbi:MAG: IS5 family transposase [Candidatus Kapaibacterium sp.]
MSRTRHSLSDEQYARIEPLLPGKASDPGATAKNNRLFIDAVLWILKTGAPWRDLNDRFGNWNTVFQRINRWSKTNRWENILAELQEFDLDEVQIDSTIVRAHQHAAEQKNAAEAEALGRSRGGLSSKIHAITDARGRPLVLTLSGGERADILTAPMLFYRLIAQAAIRDVPAIPGSVLGDRAYDADAFIELITSSGAEVVIPPRKNRRKQRFYDKERYTHRNQVERLFGRLKQSRRIATRYEKTARNFFAFIIIASLFEFF